MSKAHKNQLLFSSHTSMGQVGGISQCVCQTYRSTSHLSFVTEDVPAGPRTTADQLQPQPQAELSRS